MRLPRQLMIHKADYYTASYVADSGAKKASFTLAHSQVACNFQEAGFKVVELYAKQDKACVASMFLLDPEIYDDVKNGDRVVFSSRNYRVIGKQDLSNLGKVFRIDLGLEVA